jgi:hypothetical protein
MEKRPDAEVPEGEPDLTRRCSQCKIEIVSSNSEKLSWQSLDFCGEGCIGTSETQIILKYLTG